ncbi:MAG: F0F1 ATP synthase subunit gamma [Hyphomicrobiales bacterium]|nr:F0F1 ATP synthase subunit gamma [Hyphomicrobiales bacterium]
MPSLKDLRNRIASVTATQKITRAMQMVAAAKLRRAQEAAEAARPYAERMDKVLANLGARVDEGQGASPLLVGTGSDKTHLMVVASAERGLCGGFNGNIARLARGAALELLENGKTVKIFCVGRKARDILRRDLGSHIIDTVDLKGVRQIGFENANDIGQRILEMFEQKEFDVCTLYFSNFKSVLTQEPTALQLIPARLPDAGAEEQSAGAVAVYEYEPDEEEILADLLPLNVATQIFRGLLENAASEQGARMSAMDNATRNAGEMISDLTLLYNRSRQAQITKELIEIVSGAEAL